MSIENGATAFSATNTAMSAHGVRIDSSTGHEGDVIVPGDTMIERLSRPQSMWVPTHIVGHMAAQSWVQSIQGSCDIKAARAADHALGEGAAYPITNPSRLLADSGWR